LINRNQFAECIVFYRVIGEDKILTDFAFTKSSKHTIDFEAVRDPLPATQKLLESFFADKPAYLIRLTDNGKTLVDYAADINDSKRKTNYKAAKEGLFYITNPGPDALTLEYKANGLFVRKALPLAVKAQTSLIDIRKEAVLSLILTGKADAIKKKNINLYVGGSFDDKQKFKYKEKISVQATEAGLAFVIVPDGKYYVEVNTGVYETADVQAGKLKKLTLKIAG